MIRRALLAAAALAPLAGPALAQITTVGPIASPDGRKPQANRGPSEPAPSGVPGSRADTSLAAPAERSSLDMPPNEALFDAINRGDYNAAKEAVGRGADIHGHNILGLTPLELSVDLGRNDISFLLLSLRGAAGYAAGKPPGAAAQPAAPTPAERRAQQRAEAAARRAQMAERRAAERQPPEAPARPARFAGDGGSPVPQAGFLGFSATR